MPNFGSGEVGWTGVSEYTTTHGLGLDGAYQCAFSFSFGAGKWTADTHTT